jgi:hypothetical protein
MSHCRVCPNHSTSNGAAYCAAHRALARQANLDALARGRCTQAANGFSALRASRIQARWEDADALHLARVYLRRRYPFLQESFPEDAAQEARLAAALFARHWRDGHPRRFFQALGRHFHAAARAYGFYKPPSGTWSRRELTNEEITDDETVSSDLDR